MYYDHTSEYSKVCALEKNTFIWTPMFKSVHSERNNFGAFCMCSYLCSKCLYTRIKILKKAEMYDHTFWGR